MVVNGSDFLREAVLMPEKQRQRHNLGLVKIRQFTNR